jgi:hypothetical protein
VVPAQAGQGTQQLARLDRELGIDGGGSSSCQSSGSPLAGARRWVWPVLEERVAPTDAKQPEALVAGDDPQPADNRRTAGLASSNWSQAKAHASSASSSDPPNLRAVTRRRKRWCSRNSAASGTARPRRRARPA